MADASLLQLRKTLWTDMARLNLLYFELITILFYATTLSLHTRLFTYQSIFRFLPFFKILFYLMPISSVVMSCMQCTDCIFTNTNEIKTSASGLLSSFTIFSLTNWCADNLVYVQCNIDMMMWTLISDRHETESLQHPTHDDMILVDTCTAVFLILSLTLYMTQYREARARFAHNNTHKFNRQWTCKVESSCVAQRHDNTLLKCHNLGWYGTVERLTCTSSFLSSSMSTAMGYKESSAVSFDAILSVFSPVTVDLRGFK